MAGLAVAAAAALPASAAEPVVAYTIVDGREIPQSLTGAPGDAARGRVLYAGEARAGCPACHGMPGAREAREARGAPRAPGAEASAPDLAGVGGRLSAGEIRLWLVAPGVLDEATAMPAYYAARQRTGPEDPLYGGPALTAAEIEDLVAYLAGLRGAD